MLKWSSLKTSAQLQTVLRSTCDQ